MDIFGSIKKKFSKEPESPPKKGFFGRMKERKEPEPPPKKGFFGRMKERIENEDHNQYLEYKREYEGESDKALRSELRKTDILSPDSLLREKVIQSVLKERGYKY